MRPQNWRSTAPSLIVFIALLSILLKTDALAQQWSPPTRIHVGVGLYPALLVRGDTLHTAYTATLGGQTKIFYVRSCDSGSSWNEAIVLNDTIDYRRAYYARFLTNGARLMALWYEMTQDVSQLGYVAYSISTNGGQTWSAPQHALDPGLFLVYLFSAASVDSTVNVIYSKEVYPRMGFFIVRSTNFGRTWSSPRELFRCQETSLMDMEAYGDTFHFVWSGNFVQGVNWEVYYIRSQDQGLNWTEPETLTTPGDRGARFPALSINETGSMALCWMDFGDSPPGWIADIFFARSTNQGVNWFGEQELTFLHLDGNPDIFYRADMIHVTFERHDIPIREIWYMQSTDNGLTWGEETELDLDPADSHEPRVAYSNGKAYVIWADDRDNPDTIHYGGLYFSYCPYEPNAVSEGGNIPKTFSLKVYPNPFNSSTSITYSNLKGGEIRIFDIEGQLIRTFFTGGENEGRIKWDATDASGKTVSSGIYFARAQYGSKATAASQSSTCVKLIYLK